MKKVLIGIFFLCAGILFSQDKRTYFHAEMDMIIPNDKKVVYSFSEGEINLDERIMWGTSFTYNYKLFRKLSVGALGGLNYLSYPKVTSLKYGGSLRYIFSTDYQTNVFLQLMGYIPLNSKYSTESVEVRFGLGMPVARINDLTMTLGMYVIAANYEVVKPIL